MQSRGSITFENSSNPLPHQVLGQSYVNMLEQSYENMLEQSYEKMLGQSHVKTESALIAFIMYFEHV